MINGIINQDILRWGIVLRDTDPVYSYRSGIGITSDGRLVFGIGKDISAQNTCFCS